MIRKTIVDKRNWDDVTLFFIVCLPRDTLLHYKFLSFRANFQKESARTIRRVLPRVDAQSTYHLFCHGLATAAEAGPRGNANSGHRKPGGDPAQNKTWV